MPVIYHVSAFIDGECRRYTTTDEEELNKDIRIYQANEISFSIAKEVVE